MMLKIFYANILIILMFSDTAIIDYIFGLGS
jgi:hypothetical protein